MELRHLDIFFQIVVFMLAISVHESAHAWTAARYGDPTATLLGRVSLNPIRHIDLFGTIILPAIMIIAHGPVFGWAKPTPVDPRNFKEPVKADIMTSVAGPVSNFILVAIGMMVMATLMFFSPEAHDALVIAATQPDYSGEISGVFAITLFLFNLIVINVLLGIFNLVPLPPLDGSHVIRHFMPEEVRRIYDTAGMIGLFLFMFFGGKYLSMVISPVLGILFGMLLRIHG
jgi:Zn-dependent protease